MRCHVTTSLYPTGHSAVRLCNVTGDALRLRRVRNIMSHPITNREWVTALFLCQAVSSIISHPITNRRWVTLVYCFARQSCLIPWMHQQHVSDSTALFLCQASHLISWLTGCQWNCFISFPGNLINPVSSHNQQGVSDTASFLPMPGSIFNYV